MGTRNPDDERGGDSIGHADTELGGPTVRDHSPTSVRIDTPEGATHTQTTLRMPPVDPDTLATAKLVRPGATPSGQGVTVMTIDKALSQLAADAPSTVKLREEPPRVFGRYILRDRIASGGMADVYRAHDPQLDRPVAIKLIKRSASPGARARMVRESRVLAKLNHPNVVPIYDVGETEEAIFLAMPLLDGGTLRKWQADRALPWEAVLERYMAAGRGLIAAHGEGIVHRDFKADNVLLGSRGEVQVADFGLSRHAQQFASEDSRGRPPAYDSAITQTGEYVGTPGYMAPEQFLGGAVDARADQFSFSVSLWEALFGRLPYGGENGQDSPAALALVGRASQLELIPAPADARVPAWLTSIVARGFAVKPEQRWASLEDMLDAIQHRMRRRRVLPLLVGFLTAVLVAAAAALLLR